ncbi:MAG TPA: hypothetical protein DDX09_12340, partial [Hyphomonas atlantica]|nr:hypothetical protein [Hyphomonas atlantica]
AEKAEVITEVKVEPAPRKAVVRRAAPRPATTANVRVINGDKETLVTAPVSKPKLLTEEPS